MAQYIDKDALVAQIERLKDELKASDSAAYVEAYIIGAEHTINTISDVINTLEVKEVDIQDSIKETLAQKYINYTFRRHNIDPESKEGQLIYYAYMHGMNQCLTQLKAQKGEKL